MSLIKTRSQENNPKNIFLIKLTLEHGDADFSTEETLRVKSEIEVEARMRFYDSFNVQLANDSMDNAIRECLPYLEKYSLEKYGQTLSEYFRSKHGDDFNEEDICDWIYDDILAEDSFVFYDPRDDVDNLSEVEYNVFYYDEHGIKYKVKLGKEEF